MYVCMEIDTSNSEYMYVYKYVYMYVQVYGQYVFTYVCMYVCKPDLLFWSWCICCMRTIGSPPVGWLWHLGFESRESCPIAGPSSSGCFLF